MTNWFSFVEYGSILSFKMSPGVSIPSILNIDDSTACEFVYDHRDFFDPIPLTIDLIRQTNFVENDLSENGKYNWWIPVIPMVSYIYLSMNSRNNFTLAYERNRGQEEVVSVQFFNELQVFMDSAIACSKVSKGKNFWFDSNKLFPKLSEVDKLFPKLF